MSETSSANPDEYVRENRETLIKILMHGNDDFVRALAWAALIEYGGQPDFEKVRAELERAEEME
jgi:hypothetical protein